ncbi:MAG: SAV_6107 family HEPN domain-containing protein [Candidatus Nanopelagicales bacterium]|jgi:hypothetical protein|nr:SAV_6107 family HEPN domain-containing protein [Candidatus Nanopelagicales bacterium]MCU0294603.1 SAV_6107 family HEPN domain-containing protein [Candidatus Nanopelagicales bacterium]MCU0298199.1 SAV_6107 family HEPN domain-containing protein [Candidatus Nanopelagicales bacterium]
MAALNHAGKDLLRTALIALDDAYQATTPSQRYVAAHVAALRAGAALLALRAKPARSARIRSVWQMVPGIAPELAEWCAYFEAIGRRRIFVEIGREHVTQRQADDLVRDAEAFLEQIAGILEVGLPIPSSWRCAG